MRHRAEPEEASQLFERVVAVVLQLGMGKLHLAPTGFAQVMPLGFGQGIGAGVARRASAVRWGVAQSVIMAWIITIPASATVAALIYLLTRLF